MFYKALNSKLTQFSTALFLVYVFLFGSIIPFRAASAYSREESISPIEENASRTTKNEKEHISQNPVSSEKMKSALGNLPLSFELNQGQTDRGVKFLSRGKGYSLFLTANESVLSLRKPTAKQTSEMQTALRTKFVGANQNPQIEGLEPLAAKTNYFTGKDQKNWRTNVSQYAKVKYSAIYPGIDVIYYGKGQELEYDFVVAPGADPRKIKMEFKGADKIKIDDNGDLVLNTKLGDVRHRKPVIYQEVNGERLPVNGRYITLSKRRIGFQIESYDQTKPLVIDPVIVYSTGLSGEGSSTWSVANGISTHTAADGKVYVYIVGSTQDSDFPVKNALQASGSGTNAFIAKFDMSVSGEPSLIYSTYFGGSGDDRGISITIDSTGNAYIAGQTTSANFPIFKAIQSSQSSVYNLWGDVFITALSSDGTTLIYSTYLGGSFDEFGTSIAVDASGNAYIKGKTASNDFPMMNAYQSNIPPSVDGSRHSSYFISKIAQPVGQTPATLVYSTYLNSGGFYNDNVAGGNSIAVDASGNIYVTGVTTSPNFPVLNGFQTQLTYNLGTAFVTKLNPSASGSAQLLYSTYLGGAQGSGGVGITVDSTGNAFVTGTAGDGLPTTAGAYKENSSDYGFESFVTKIDTTKSGAASLIYSTYLGSSHPADSASSIAIDAAGNAYVTGETISYDFPLVNSPQSYNYGVFQSIDGGNKWTTMNKDLVVSGIRGLALDTTTSPRTLYAGTESTGVYKSTNGGISWNAANNGLANPNVKAILLNPSNPSTIYAATDGGVFRSVDGGGSWSALNSGLDNQASTTINSLFADTNQVNGVTSVTIYATTGAGLYKFVEGASSWSATGLNEGVSSLAIDTKTSPHTLFATTREQNFYGVLQSTDGGANWEALETPYGNLVKVAVDTQTTPSTLYVQSSDGGSVPFILKRLPDLSWQGFDTGIETGGVWASFVVDTKTMPSTLYFVDYSGGVIKSTDSAATWSHIFNRGAAGLAIDTASTAPQSPLYIANTSLDRPDIFVSKLNPTGTSLLFSTVIGGSNNDRGTGIALDASDNIYVAGYTDGQFPTVNGYKEIDNRQGGHDAIVLKLGSAALPSTSTETVTTEMAVQTGTLEVALPNVQATNTNGGPAPTTSVEPIDNTTTANLTISNNLGAYEIKVNNAIVNTTGYFSTGCTTDGNSVPCWEKHGIKIGFTVPTVNDVAVFNNLVISHGEDTDNNPSTPLVLVPYDQPQGSARHTYKDFATRTIWVYTASLSPFVILKGAGDQISDLIKLTKSFNLRQGIENSLDAKLQNAQRAYQAARANDRATACNIMRAFASEVQAQSGRAITISQAQQLLNSAKQIQVVLGCS